MISSVLFLGTYIAAADEASRGDTILVFGALNASALIFV
jgi:hypothetical protein